eukprot:9471392-Pyramimonas_sp.AAC.1
MCRGTMCSPWKPFDHPVVSTDDSRLKSPRQIQSKRKESRSMRYCCRCAWTQALSSSSPTRSWKYAVTTTGPFVKP